MNTKTRYHFITCLKLTVFFIAAFLIFQGCSSSGSDIKTDDPEAAFRQAKRNFDRGDYTDAVTDFSFLKIKFPGTSISDKVQFYLAESYFRDKEYQLASYEYETMLRNYPLSPLIPETRYKLGLSYYYQSPKYSLDQTYTKYAISEFQGFIEQFPEDKNITDATAKLNELKNKLAYKEFKNGELYMTLGNYRSAALYFSNVVDNYIDSEWADDAMVGQIEALIAVNKYDEARKIVERFYKLFPNSQLRSKVDSLKLKI